MVCFGYIIVNTLHKGGKKDDGNDDDDDNNNNSGVLEDLVFQWHNGKDSSNPIGYVLIVRFMKSHRSFGNDVKG
jgi:hypothetical protein